MTDFAHIRCAKTRAYLTSDESTTLDLAGTMIDVAEIALRKDAANPDIPAGVFLDRDSALARARRALGQRNSLDVRQALRDFWSK